MPDLIDTLWAAEVQRRNAGGHIPMMPEANFRRGAEAALALQAERAWQPIETAPRHVEVLCYREDCGVFVAQLTEPGCVIPENELEGLDFPEDFIEWWHAGFGWMEGSEKPTHWQPMVAGPAGEGKPT